MGRFTRLTILALGMALAAPAAAQVRREADTAAMVNPDASPALQSLFARSGLFMIAGGVLPSGHTLFLLERHGADQPVAPGSVRLALLADGTAALTHGGMSYRIGMPAGLACPLGEFVGRGGVIAYTVPRYMDPRSRLAMREAGLAHHRVAREFDGTAFESLLRAADFAQTEPLPPAVASRIAESINESHGLRGMVLNASDDDGPMIGSFINSDLQMTYHVYLMPPAEAKSATGATSIGTVEIGGVPLRYFWKLDGAGGAAVFGVEIYAQNWPASARLADLTKPGAQPTQYDVVNLYQVAALFRAVHETDAAGFTAFVGQACQHPG